MASAAAAEETTFRRRIQDAGKAAAAMQTLNEQIISNDAKEQELLHQRLQNASEQEQAEIKEQLARASESELRAKKAQQVNAEAVEAEKAALSQGIKACAATASRVEWTEARALRRVVAGQRVAAVSSRKHTCTDLFAESERRLKEYKSQLVVATEHKQALGERLKAHGEDESIRVAFAEATDACLRAERRVQEQATDLKRKQEALVEASDLERRLQREQGREIGPLPSDLAELDEMAKGLLAEQQQVEQEMEKERTKDRSQLLALKAEESDLLEKAKASPKTDQHVEPGRRSKRRDWSRSNSPCPPGTCFSHAVRKGGVNVLAAATQVGSKEGR